MSDSHLELRKWYAGAQGTPEFALALKHRHAMPDDEAAAWKEHAKGDENEKELALVYALFRAAEAVQLVPGAPTIPAAAELEPTTHVDVTPLGAIPDDTDPPSK